MKKQILVKHDTAENWKKAINFIPKNGELIIYDGIMEDDKYIESPKIKVGDGIHTVTELPFLLIDRTVEDEILKL